MKTIRKAIAAVLAAGIAAAGGLAGCSQGGTASKQAKTIQIGYVNWSEDIAMTNLLEVILEDKMGYQVKQVQTDVAPVFASLSSGGTDLFLDCWLPVTHKAYMDRYGSEVEDLGVSFSNAKIGLTVPDYVKISSIDELNAHKDEFGSQIVGIDSGAGIMTATETAIKDYGLSYQLMPGSGPTMTAALKKAIEGSKPIVVTGWQPHWMFSRWKLKFLDDPKGVYGKSEEIHKIARKGFASEYPKVGTLLKNFKMTDKQLGDLMDAVENSDKPLEAARSWMKDNQSLVDGWLK